MSKETTFDKIGMGMSAVCLVHCLLLPVILATLPFLSFLSFMKSPLTETFMVLFALANSVIAVTLGFKKHKSYAVPAIFVAGAILLGAHFYAHDFVHSNEYIIIAGAALVGAGHIVNKRLCSTCPTCEISQ